MHTKFVAEISSNHNGDMGRCRALIDAAKEAGCDSVKFQLFRIDELFAPEILAKSEEHRNRRAWELPVKFLPELAERTKSLGMEFSCTPFYIDAVRELEPYVDFYKIASYELLWPGLFEACAATGKPLVISTGMATLDEVEGAVARLAGTKLSNLTVLHCTSAYPTPVADANLGAMSTMRRALEKFQKHMDIHVGLSDHTVSPGVVLKSIFKYDASFVEFHFDLEGDGAEFKAGHCWLPSQIAPVIKAAREGAVADGHGRKEPAPSELPDRQWRADPSDGLRPFKAVRETFPSGKPKLGL